MNKNSIALELDLASNMLGKLTPDTRARLRAAYERPGHDTWDRAFSIILDGRRMLTLWQAVIAVDPTFPRVGKTTDARGRVLKPWARVPDSALIARALRYATH